MSWMDAKGNGACQELDLADRKSLMSALDTFVRNLDQDVSQHRTDRYAADLPSSYARCRVSPAVLEGIMRESPRKNTAETDQNVISLKTRALGDIQPLIEEVFRELVLEGRNLRVGCSGKFWYPANGYMGWHTNSAARGCRLYCTYARKAGRSFFRYRVPESGAIRTSWDGKGWHFRLFQIGSVPFWHAVYSETDRFSLGFKLVPNPPPYGRPGQPSTSGRNKP